MQTIPQQILEFLNQPLVAYLGTRSNDMKPQLISAWGALPGADNKSLTVFIPQATSDKTLQNLESNGDVSGTFAEILSSQAYQFKGSYVSHRPMEENEIAYQQSSLQGLAGKLQMVGLPDEFVANFNISPSVAVTFSLKEIFIQTPGPNAGKKVE